MRSKRKTEPLAELRKGAGVTLREAAKMAGVALSTMHGVEHRRTELSAEQLKALLKLYSRRLTERTRRVEKLMNVGF